MQKENVTYLAYCKINTSSFLKLLVTPSSRQMQKAAMIFLKRKPFQCFCLQIITMTSQKPR